MEKNLFWKTTKFVVVILTMMMSFTSCQGLIDAVIGTQDKPTTSQETVTPTAALVKTESGAIVTANTPVEISGLLDQLKSDIAAKGVNEYEVKIPNTTVETTSSDNSISVPRVVGSNINLNFGNVVKSTVPLIVKAAETASEEPTTAVNKLTITMPDVDETNAIDLELNMPETTVILKTSGTQTVYDDVVATTAINTLYINPGVVVKRLRVSGGTVVVKNGGSIETYVYPIGKIGTSEESKIIASYSQDLSSCGIKPILLDIFGREKYEISTDEEGLNPYYIKNLKVVKGTGGYAHIVFNNTFDMIYDEDGLLVDIGDNYPIETLTIGDGATVLLSPHPQIKNIVGEGEQTAKILSEQYYDKPEGSGENSENCFYLDYVQKMSNIIVDSHSPKGLVANFARIRAPLQLENCLFNNWSSMTLKGSKSGNDYVKKCDFPNVGWFRIEVEGRDFNKALFENCKFNSGTTFVINVNSSDIKVDEKGNRVYEYQYNWWNFSQSGSHIPGFSLDMADIPTEKLAVGRTEDAYVNGDYSNYSKGYWVTKQLLYEDYDISNKSYTFEFNDCVLPNPMIFEGNRNTYKNDLFIYDIIKFIINGHSHKVVPKSESGIITYVLE